MIQPPSDGQSSTNPAPQAPLYPPSAPMPTGPTYQAVPYAQPAHGGYPRAGVATMAPPAGSVPPFPAMPAVVNSSAKNALVLSFVAFFPVCAVLSIWYGVSALRQIRKTDQRGTGRAITGICISVLSLAVLGGIFAYDVADDARRDGSGAIADGGSLTADKLEVGDCFTGVSELDTEVERVEAVPCTQPHGAEIFAIFALGGGKYPDDAAMVTQAEAGCDRLLAGYSPKAAEDDTLEFSFLHPTEDGWSRGDRNILCLAVTNPPRAGSLRG